jgi:hypothetical protein
MVIIDEKPLRDLNDLVKIDDSDLYYPYYSSLLYYCSDCILFLFISFLSFYWVLASSNVALSNYYKRIAKNKFKSTFYPIIINEIKKIVAVAAPDDR